MTPYKWLFKYVKEHISLLIVSAVLTLLYVGLTFVQPVVLGNLISNIKYDNNISILGIYSGVLLGAILVKEGIWYLRQYIYERVSQKAIFNIRCNTYRKLEKLDLSYYENNRTGDIMSAITSDIEAIRLVIASTIPMLFTQIVMIIIGLVTLLSINVVVTLFVLSLTPFIAFFSIKYNRASIPHYAKIRKSRADLTTVTQENISGNRIVKAFSREEFENEKFNKYNNIFLKESLDYVETWCKYFPFVGLFTNCVTAVFLLTSCCFLISGNMNLGDFTSMNGIMWCLVTPMQQLGFLLNQFEQFKASSVKLISIENEQPKISDKHKILKKNTGINGKIEFRNVSFGYDQTRALKSVNFTANPGQTIAIIGPTGSGKSSIVNLIARFYEAQEGTVLIDDINIKNIDLETLRKNTSYAMQDIFLFSDTIKNNIAYAVPDATDADIERVAKIANAHDFISKLPDGYNTIVGERGLGLSGGQRQRISLARALLKNPSILILDDTTSAIDTETEYMIQNMLKESFTNRTTIIIAHRISSVKNADLILVLKDGRLVEWGNHDQLIKQDGYYKTAYNEQYGDFNKMKDYHIEFPGGEF